MRNVAVLSFRSSHDSCPHHAEIHRPCGGIVAAGWWNGGSVGETISVSASTGRGGLPDGFLVDDGADRIGQRRPGNRRRERAARTTGFFSPRTDRGDGRRLAVRGVAVLWAHLSHSESSSRRCANRRECVHHHAGRLTWTAFHPGADVSVVDHAVRVRRSV